MTGVFSERLKHQLPAPLDGEAAARFWNDLATPHQALLEGEFRRRPPHTVAEACERIEQLTGVRRGPTQVREFLRETMGLRWRKVAAVPVPPKQTLPEHAATQAAFLKDGA